MESTGDLGRRKVGGGSVMEVSGARSAEIAANEFLVFDDRLAVTDLIDNFEATCADSAFHDDQSPMLHGDYACFANSQRARWSCAYIQRDRSSCTIHPALTRAHPQPLDPPIASSGEPF
jgi:hypothetical protein